jgi:hypothetical protein
MTSESEEAFMSDHEVVYRVVCPDGYVIRTFIPTTKLARDEAESWDGPHGHAHVVQSGIISWDEE